MTLGKLDKYCQNNHNVYFTEDRNPTELVLLNPTQYFPTVIDDAEMTIWRPLGFQDTGIMNDKDTRLLSGATPIIGSNWYRVDLGNQFCISSINWTHWPRMGE